MSIACTLGLAVCLNYHGTLITDEDAFLMTYYCEEISALPPTSFLMNSKSHWGYIDAGLLEELGLKFSWKPQGKANEAQLGRYRKQELARACSDFYRIKSQRRNWTE